MSKKTIRDIDVLGKKVLVRCDFNVPQDENGNITDTRRIVGALPTIKYLIEHNAKVILCSHLGRPKGEVKKEFSLKPVKEELSKELGIEVIQKRVSDLVSKWVGETEQNIANAFAEAKDKKAMLIFDEADSFLQNRQKAVNSWEVTEVNEVLTQMENFEYPFICTTNLLDTLDEASLRRFTFKIKFDFMDKEQVKKALKHFFNITDSDIYIKGLTCGDFANVKKRTDFLSITETKEIIKMLQEEVKIKKSKELQNQIGF